MEELLKKYASVILNSCLKVEKNQPLFISANYERVDFVKILANIAYEIGKVKKDKILVGFAAETNDLIENATKKVKKKNLDFIVANDLTKEGAGFGVDTNIVKIIDKEGSITEYPIMTKDEVANVILDKVKDLLEK